MSKVRIKLTEEGYSSYYGHSDGSEGTGYSRDDATIFTKEGAQSVAAGLMRDLLSPGNYMTADEFQIEFEGVE